MSLILILGASRGLGKALTQAYVEQGHRVIATVRKAEDMAAVQDLGAQVLQVDLANPASISGLAWQLDGKSIDLALYVAGVWDGHAAGVPPTQQQFDAVMHSNVLGFMQALPQIAPWCRRLEAWWRLFPARCHCFQCGRKRLAVSRQQGRPQYGRGFGLPAMARTDAAGAGSGLDADRDGWQLCACDGGAKRAGPDAGVGASPPEDRGSLLRYDGTRTRLLDA
jgi:NAD(P)-dependent dehydrogenase (short-subunit alcohol dehydrogenase family)